MFKSINDFSHTSSLRTKNLLQSNEIINICVNKENCRRKKKECTSHRLNDLARPNVRRIRSIFERQRKKSKFDMIRAEKLLKLMNKPIQKPCDVKRCIKELVTVKEIKNKKIEQTAHHSEKNTFKCIHDRDIKASLQNRKVSPENCKIKCNNILNLQNHSTRFNNMPVTSTITNYAFRNFKASRENYLPIEVYEREFKRSTQINKTSNYVEHNNFFKEPEIKKIPLSKDLVVLEHESIIINDSIDNDQKLDDISNETLNDFNSTKQNQIEVINSGEVNEGFVNDTEKIEKHNQLKKLHIDLIEPLQTTFDSGYADRIDSVAQSFMQKPVALNINYISEIPEIINLHQNVAFSTEDFQRKFLNEPIVEKIQSIENSLNDTEEQVLNLKQNSNNSGGHNILKSNTNQHNQLNESELPIIDNSSIIDSSILKLRNESTSINYKLSHINKHIKKQSTFDGSAENSNFESFVDRQEQNSSRKRSHLPVVALRNFSRDHDLNYDKDKEILVRVTKSNFDKLYVIRKIEDDSNLDDFCNQPATRRSKLFILNDSDKRKIEVRRLEAKHMKTYCENEHESELEDCVSNSLLSRINHEKFSVQRLNRISLSTFHPKSSDSLDIQVSENLTKQSNYTAYKH